jgi:hypothetical protein
MAITPGTGHSWVHKNRRYENYQSMKQAFSDRRVEEVVIEGRTTTDGALAEINFAVGDTINYIGAEGQAYIRTELADATQNSKFVYLQYQDDTGAVQDWVTADLDAADTTTEIAIGSTDFYRVRQMYCEVEAVATKGIVLTDANMGGADDVYAFINDTYSTFNLERFFTQPSTVCDSYLGHVHVHTTPVAIGAGTDTYLFSYTCTPKALSDGGETGAASDKEFVFIFQEEFNMDPMILLEPATEVIFKVGDAATANVVHIQATLLEVYPPNSTPSS